MKYTQLGRTGLKVSRLVLGTMNFGPQTNESDSHAIMDAALGAGLNFFDTANVYGWGENKGRTEEILGTWFAQGGGRRDKVVLATKMYGNMAPEGDAWPNHDKLSAVNIRRAVDASLKRLQTDHIDVYQFHRRRPGHPVRGDLAGHRRPGPAGQDPVRGLLELPRLQDRPGQRAGGPARFARPGQRAVPLQPRRAPRRDGGHPGRAGVRRRGHPLVAVAGRSAGRRHQEGGQGRPPRLGPLGRRAGQRTVRAQIEAYEDLLEKHGLEPGGAGSAWLLTRPGITGPIVGPRTAEQLEGALRAVELELPEAVLTGLDEIFPGPGPSPEAFAW
ncbi:Aldo/keto reductase OS=Streptomyces cyaneofuscatus OX=66883 GN=G3I52_20200 PE=4 SV=1 [Streptomyces cyaneofuscatus]